MIEQICHNELVDARLIDERRNDAAKRRNRPVQPSNVSCKVQAAVHAPEVVLPVEGHLQRQGVLPPIFVQQLPVRLSFDEEAILFFGHEAAYVELVVVELHL